MTTLSVGNSISRLPLRRGFLLIALVLACFALAPNPKAFGVSRPPDAGYAGANTAEGQNALQSLTSGIHNTALGFQTLFSNTTGIDNTATGFQALPFNTTGHDDTAGGFKALYNNTTGFENTGAGLQAAVKTNGQAGRALGTFILGPTTTQGCPSGFTCNTFTVICPGIATITGVIADQKPVGQIQGMVMFFSGDTGTTWWSGTSPEVPAFFQSLLDSGFELVQIQWLDNGWLLSLPGVQSGEELLASRPATVIKWVHDNMYGPLGLHPSVGQCGFCVTGNSAGAAQITYAISSYGIDNIVDAAIPTSGPPMAAISKGCLQEPGYAYDPGKAGLIDESYGFSGTDVGPCMAHDPSFTDTWIANSVETGGIKYNYPTTRVQIIIGGEDNVIISNHARDYFQVLVQAQQPMLTWRVVPLMAHEITESVDGLSALYTALTTHAPTPTPTPTPIPTPTPATLGNISCRLQVGTTDRVMIAGFIVHGSSPKTVLIRSLGPSLSRFGVPGVLANPQLELHDATSLIGMNNDWQTTQIGGVITSNQVTAIRNSGLAPTDPLESALIAALPPGNYTAIVRGVNNTTGNALAEVYDLSANSGSLLANISTRGFVQTADNVMIGGFIVVTQPTRVIIRAIGPSLTQFGVPAALANPTLELHDHTQAVIGRNDDWQRTEIGGIITSDQVTEIRNSHLAPTNPLESAIIATLQPGNYTAIVRGVNNTMGNALVEVYDLQ
jgi:hypothetical protein